MQNRITIEIPENIPAPKFHLFQTVCYCTCNGKKYPGVITGMTYTTPIEGLIQTTNYGWTYEINYVLNKSVEEVWALTQKSEPTDAYVSEDSIHACSEDS